MEPPEAGSEDEEEAVAEADDKRPQRRKRRRRRGRGDLSAEPSFPDSAASPVLDAESGDEGAEEEAQAFEIAASGAGQPGVSDDVPAKNGAESEQEAQFRRNRRRGRRGGRRHRDDIAGGAEFAKPQGDSIPGLGEQPVIPFDVHFPKNLQLGPINREPAAREMPAMQPEPLSAASHALPEIEPAPVAGFSPLAAPEPLAEPEAATAPAPDVPETVTEASPEPAPAAETPATAAPVQAPKPKPVRTGPPRKGWWQRRTG